MKLIIINVSARFPANLILQLNRYAFLLCFVLTSFTYVRKNKIVEYSLLSESVYKLLDSSGKYLTFQL